MDKVTCDVRKFGDLTNIILLTYPTIEGAKPSINSSGKYHKVLIVEEGKNENTTIGIRVEISQNRSVLIEISGEVVTRIKQQIYVQEELDLVHDWQNVEGHEYTKLNSYNSSIFKIICALHLEGLVMQVFRPITTAKAFLHVVWYLRATDVLLKKQNEGTEGRYSPIPKILGILLA